MTGLLCDADLGPKQMEQQCTWSSNAADFMTKTKCTVAKRRNPSLAGLLSIYKFAAYTRQRLRV